MAFPLPKLTVASPLGLPLAHRFGVFFFLEALFPNPVDIRFQRVSGLNTRVQTKTVPVGGRNCSSRIIPERLSHDNLVLERGLVLGSPLNLQLDLVIHKFKFLRSDVLVTLFNEEAEPLAAWMFKEAYPVRWATADLHANEDRILIDTLELAYSRMLPVRL